MEMDPYPAQMEEDYTLTGFLSNEMWDFKREYFASWRDIERILGLNKGIANYDGILKMMSSFENHQAFLAFMFNRKQTLTKRQRYLFKKVQK